VRLLDTAGNPISETRITFVSPQVETETQTVLAKATIQNPQGKLRISQQVRAQITWGVHEGPSFPACRITHQWTVLRVRCHQRGKGTVARQTPLKLGDTIGNDFVFSMGSKPEIT